MRFVEAEQGSLYEVTPEEKVELSSWFDTILAVADPHFPDEADGGHTWTAPNGTVHASKKKVPLPGTITLDELSIFCIVGEEIFETNPEKGIFFYDGRPKEGEYSLRYDIALSHNNHIDPTYANRLNIWAQPPYDQDQKYLFHLNFVRRPELQNRTKPPLYLWDNVRYIIPAMRNAVIVDALGKDLVDDTYNYHPLPADKLERHSLQIHSCFIADILGLEVPGFILDLHEE